MEAKLNKKRNQQSIHVQARPNNGTSFIIDQNRIKKKSIQ